MLYSKTAVSIINFLHDDFKHRMMYPCLGSLLEIRLALGMKYSSLGILYKLLDENTIGRQRWNITTQGRKFI